MKGWGADGDVLGGLGHGLYPSQGAGEEVPLGGGQSLVLTQCSTEDAG